MTTLYLVRHGQAAFGKSNYDQLSDLGARQSTVLGQHWAKLNRGFDAVYSGTMSRQQDTCRHTLAELACTTPVTTHTGFNEYDFENILRTYLPVAARNHPELGIQNPGFMQNPKLFQPAFEKGISYWLEDHPHEQNPFETWSSFSTRVIAALKEVTAPERKSVVAFTSGGVIAVALREALGLTNEMTFRLNWRINNGSVHVFRMGRNGLSLMAYNNIAHLELAGDPSLITFR